MSTPAGPGGYPGQSQQPQQPGAVAAGEPGYGAGAPPAPGFPAGGYGGQQMAQQGGGPGGGGPGVGDRVSHVTDTVARHVKTPETKEFFKTSEFIVWALTVIGILIAAAAVTEGKGHDFPAITAWLYVTIASSAYIISRGIAKAATRRGYGDAPFDNGSGGGGGAPFQRGGGY